MAVTSKSVPQRVRAAKRRSVSEVDPKGPDDTVRTLPIIEETAKVEKRRVDKGGYRITKRVESRQETVDELLRDRHVVVERRPIGLTLDTHEMPEQRYEGDVLVIPVVKEVLVTEKRLVLIEEVRITHIHGTHRNPQQVTLRTEQISVERLNPEAPSGTETSQSADTRKARQRNAPRASRSRR